MNILSPAGWLYGRIADLRNLLFDKGVFKSYPLGARTISVGNITAGGTGKTPLVAYIAELLAANGEKVCILTRGYGRENPRRRVLISDFEQVIADAKIGGDEPVELAGKLLGKAIVVAGADRVAAAKWALENFAITAFVLDDAFQHRRAKRDLDIVCVDATNSFGNGQILPAGTLREPISNLSRANMIVITRVNLTEDISNLRSDISTRAPKTHTFEASNTIANLITLADFRARSQRMQREDRNEERSRKFLAFCGLGNPSSFFRQLAADGFDLVVKKPFPDHHYYSQEEIRKLENLGRSAAAGALLTTAKDAVKLEGIEFTMPCFVAETELELNYPEGFHRLVTSS
jgi:tetraacyldisaccharide 4'-kinase